jgi:hypothetical protein
MRIRAILLCVFGLIILAAYFYGPSLRESSRLRAIRQTVRLTERTVMQVNDAWIYPADPSHELLRVHVTYIGDDPNREHYMLAEIGHSPDDTRFTRTMQWQVGLPGSERDKLWEFQNFPRDGSPIFIRLYLRSGGPGGPELVRTFSIPDRLRESANG